MYLSNINAFSGIGNFQNRSVFPGASALFPAGEEAQTTLQKLSDQIITGQKGGEVSGNLSQIAQIKKDAYMPDDSSDTSELDEISTGMLELCMGILRIWSTDGNYANELSDFKEHLQGMDSTIQGYQDILDGKTPLQEGQNMECIRVSCEIAKKQREQFFEYGMTRFSRPQSAESCDDRAYEKLISLLLGDCRFAEKDGFEWAIDPNAADIYSELDRAITHIRSRAEEVNRGISRLYGLLYKRGYGEKYRYCLDAGTDSKPSNIAQEIASWKQNIEQLRQTPLKETEETPLQTSAQDFLLK